MSADATEQPVSPQGASREPTEQELREAYEAELSRVTTTDMLGQAAVSLLNIGARRLGAPEQDPGAGAAGAPQRDLEQVRDAIDGVKAMLEILERRIPGELKPLRDALSQLQMAYTREVKLEPAPTQAAAPADAPGAPRPAPAAGGAAAPQGEERPGGPGPAESSGRLWVPGR